MVRPARVWLGAALAALLLAALAPATAQEPEPTAPAPAEAAATHTRRLPMVFGPGGCPTASSRSYAHGPVYQQDTDNPVRLAAQHADKNIDLRSYKHNPSAPLNLVVSRPDDPTGPPQLATLFNPARKPGFTNGYQIYHWQWAPSPNPGIRGPLNTDWPVTVLGMAVSKGEALRVPASGYDIGGGMEVIVLYADENSVTFKYGREDSVAPHGYTLHLDNLCTDPNLLSLYRQLDNPHGLRYQLHPGTPDQNPDYNLPNLPAGQVFGTARTSEVRVAIVDSGSWMDPRFCNDWWVGYCP